MMLIFLRLFDADHRLTHETFGLQIEFSDYSLSFGECLIVKRMVMEHGERNK